MERIPLLGNTLRETMLAKDFSFTMMDAKYLCICRRAKHMLSVSQIQQTCHQHQKQTCHQHQKQTCHQHQKQTCHQHQKQQQKQLWNEWSTAMCETMTSVFKDSCGSVVRPREIYLYIKCTKNNADLSEVKTTFPWSSQNGKPALWGSISPWPGAM